MTRGITGALLAAVIAGAIVAAVPPSDARQYAVLVRPQQADRLLDGLQQLGGGVLWVHPSGAIWVFAVKDPPAARRLYQHGALWVTASPAALGCLSWTSDRS